MTTPTTSSIHADDTNPHGLQAGDQLLVLVQQQDLSYAPAIRNVLSIEAHDDGVQVRTQGGQHFFYRNGEYAKRLNVQPATDVKVYADEVRKNLANAKTRLGFLEAKTSGRAILGQQIESIKIDLQVAEITLNNLTGEA